MLRGETVYFKEVRRDWRPAKDMSGLGQFSTWAKKEVDHPLPERRIKPLP